MPRLSNTTMGRARNVRLPAYDRTNVTSGIVHLGIGNFHRAHQAVYVDDCLAEDPCWGIVGVSLRHATARDALGPQDGLYTLAVRGAEQTETRIVGSVLEVLFSGDHTDRIIARMADPAIGIVSMTVTEKGYCHDPATGDLDPDHRAIRADLRDGGAPSTVPAILTAALAARRQAGTAPFTILCCDNLRANGPTVGRIVTQYAALVDDALAGWIAREVAFPSTMVDRITPATTEADREAIRAATGLCDAAPVVTEPFTQWVIEDRFCAGRPPLERAGAELVSDVEPYERMKLRMLNGAHSTLAYCGQLLGHETVADAMADPRLARLVRQVMDEAAATLSLPAADLGHYAAALADRFANPALRHRTAQIAMDGSQKIPQRLLGTIRDAHGAAAEWGGLARGVAAWIAYIRRRDVDDPMRARLAALAADHADPLAHADAVLDMREVFGDLADADWFRTRIRAIIAAMMDTGPEAILSR